MRKLLVALGLVAALGTAASAYYCTTTTVQIGSNLVICAVCYDAYGNVVSVRCF